MRGGPVSRILSRAQAPLDDHSSAPPVTKGSQAANPGLSGVGIPAGGIGYPTGPRARPLFGIAPGGACRASPVTSPAVGFYPTVSPLPRCAEGEPWGRGSLFSVALSLGLPPPGVTRHPCQRESGLSSKLSLRGHPALRARRGLCARGPCVNRKAAGKVSGQRPVCGIQRPKRARGQWNPTAQWPKGETAGGRRSARFRSANRGSQRRAGQP